MALTAAEKVQVVKITGVTLSALDYILDQNVAYLTTELESAVRDELDRWETAGAEFISVEPNLANLGARIDPEREKEDIRQNLARLLFLNGASEMSSVEFSLDR